MTRDEISELSTRATRISNSYSSLFQASTTLTQVIGHDDYQYVLKSIMERVCKHEEEITAAIAESRKKE